jgi:hypothetical protein
LNDFGRERLGGRSCGDVGAEHGEGEIDATVLRFERSGDLGVNEDVAGELGDEVIDGSAVRGKLVVRLAPCDVVDMKFPLHILILVGYNDGFELLLEVGEVEVEVASNDEEGVGLTVL